MVKDSTGEEESSFHELLRTLSQVKKLLLIQKDVGKTNGSMFYCKPEKVGSSQDCSLC